jgi:hypothetical protein
VGEGRRGGENGGDWGNVSKREGEVSHTTKVAQQPPPRIISDKMDDSNKGKGRMEWKERIHPKKEGLAGKARK